MAGVATAGSVRRLDRLAVPVEHGRSLPSLNGHRRFSRPDAATPSTGQDDRWHARRPTPGRTRPQDGGRLGSDQGAPRRRVLGRQQCLERHAGIIAIPGIPIRHHQLDRLGHGMNKIRARRVHAREIEARKGSAMPGAARGLATTDHI